MKLMMMMMTVMMMIIMIRPKSLAWRNTLDLYSEIPLLKTKSGCPLS